jgi:glycosyltransferase involved in cell wall biosynthesis
VAVINGKKIVIVMPAYNAERTVKKTYDEIPKDFIDDVLLVDDASADSTLEVARGLGMKILFHDKNRGYGANQKTCYKAALEMGADIVVMLHPDYQYSPTLIPAIVTLLVYGPYEVVLGSRIIGGGALKGGMPKYKYVANRLLTAFQNLLWRSKFSEFHTGLRGFRRYVLEGINFHANSDDFIFDNQILAQILRRGYSVGEISCPTLYFPEASSISFKRALRYGFGVVETTFELLLARRAIWTPDYLKIESTRNASK